MCAADLGEATENGLTQQTDKRMAAVLTRARIGDAPFRGCAAKTRSKRGSFNRQTTFEPIWLGDERPKASIFKDAGCERPALLVNSTNVSTPSEVSDSHRQHVGKDSC
jgi:hypothetical protein